MRATRTEDRAGVTEDIQSLAQEFLGLLKEGQDTGACIQQLADLEKEDLFRALPDDQHKLAFWINLYNAYNLFHMAHASAGPDSQAARLKHFTERKLLVAGQRLSLNDIEHAILRRGRIWWGLGWLRNPLAGAFVRRVRPSRFDPRIHFALNCGAVSCPPLRFYAADSIGAELDMAARGFCQAEVQLSDDQRTLRVSSIFRMYQGDFGGARGILRFIRSHHPGLPEHALSLRYLPYDWTPYLDSWEEK